MVGSWTDWKLSELGVGQANRIGERLKAELSEKEFVIYSSDLLREKQTADIAAESRRDEWNRLQPFFDAVMASDDEKS